MKPSYIEIELTNGKRILVENDWEKIYDVKEKFRFKFKLMKKFPFFKIIRQRIVSFKVHKTYNYMESVFDPSYAIKNSLLDLATMFGVSVKSFEQNMIECELKNF